MFDNKNIFSKSIANYAVKEEISDLEEESGQSPTNIKD
jgi:hypothetical protein